VRWGIRQRRAFLLREMRKDHIHNFNRCVMKIQESRVKCAICGKSLGSYSSDCILHHIDYKDDKTIQVCRSCHRKIHSKKAKFPDLAPDKPKVNDRWNENKRKPKKHFKRISKQTFSESFDSPSEKFKQAKQKKRQRKAFKVLIVHTKYLPSKRNKQHFVNNN